MAIVKVAIVKVTNSERKKKVLVKFGSMDSLIEEATKKLGLSLDSSYQVRMSNNFDYFVTCGCKIS